MGKESLNSIGRILLAVGSILFIFFFIGVYLIQIETFYVVGLAIEGFVGVICVVLGSGALYKAKSL